MTWSLHATWSPDGKRLVYASTASGQSQIWAMNADGSQQTQLTLFAKGMEWCTSQPHTR